MNKLPAWFWWPYLSLGALGWTAVGIAWRRSGDLEGAIESVCGAVASLASEVGYGLAVFWLLSTAGAAVLGLVAGFIVAIVWIITRARGRAA